MAIVMTDVTQVEVRVRSLIHSARTAPAKDCRPATRGRLGRPAVSRARCRPVRDARETGVVFWRASKRWTPMAGPAAALMDVVMVRQSSGCSWPLFFLNDSRLGGPGPGVIVPVAERSRGGLLPLREEGSSAGTMSRCLDREMTAGLGAEQVGGRLATARRLC